jgi:hypothetical protein
LKTPEAKEISSTLRVRKAPSTEVVEQSALKAVGVTATVEPVRCVKAGSGIQFRVEQRRCFAPGEL